MRQVVAALEKAGYRLDAETEGHIKMVKLIDVEHLRMRPVIIPCPAEGENLTVGSLNAVMEQTGIGRTALDAVATPEEKSTDPFLRP
ncbi:MAG: type II toxin-antitoxin system HicA family toxin [Chloroflexi bacterium]|nr:type II toxin-antitoxin system HicA family toxin [Chloroflexota bacterium]